MPTYAVALFGKYLTYALLAVALNLVWGYCGILSLGHGAFFALGGYAMGMYLMRQIGSRGVYANPILPDFMVFLNWKALPWFWYGFDSFFYAALMIVLVPGVLALVFGWFAFRSRVTGVYLSIITQALTYALLLAFFRNNFGFGGNNGLTDFKDILGFDIQSDATRSALFAATAIALALGVLVTAAIVRSKFGKVLIAVRDAESRTRFLGYRVEHVKLFAFVVSACMAGIAGALYVPQVGIINPSEFAPANSIEVVIWTAVGGRATLAGPIIGAVLVNLGEELLHRRVSGRLALPARRALHRGDAVPAAAASSARSRKASASWWRATAPSSREKGMSPPHDPSPADASSCGTADGHAVRLPRGLPGSGGGVASMAEKLSASLLYLNNVTRLVRRVQGAERAVARGRGGRDARHHRAERRRQDDDDGRRHRQDPARRGRRLLRGQHRPDPARRGGDRRARHRPQVPEADGVRVPHGLGQSGAGAEGRARRLRHALPPQQRRGEAAQIEDILETIRLGHLRDSLAGNLSHGQKQWLEIGMLLRRTRSSCSSTSRPPA